LKVSDAYRQAGLLEDGEAVTSNGRTPTDTASATWAQNLFERLAQNVERVIQGKPEVVRLALVCLCAEGHLLIEDKPGLGKTSMARSIARSIGGEWQRVQFTPDLLPSDITGVMVYNQGTAKFEFHPGPVFANVLLADEINRATPKTQSALLEVMQENRVTVDGTPHAVPRPFIVVATQNPIEMDGTYRLPEAQLDRFLMRIEVGYPDHDAEVRVLQGERVGMTPDELEKVLTLDEMTKLIQHVHAVRVDDEVASYAVALAAATREHGQVALGASPRGSIGLMRAARAWAVTQDRAYVTPDDLKAVAQPVLAHRLLMKHEAELRHGTAQAVVEEVLATVEVPLANAAGEGRRPR
jgi:MoxR-like ATPase